MFSAFIWYTFCPCGSKMTNFQKLVTSGDFFFTVAFHGCKSNNICQWYLFVKWQKKIVMEHAKIEEDVVQKLWQCVRLSFNSFWFDFNSWISSFFSACVAGGAREAFAPLEVSRIVQFYLISPKKGTISDIFKNSSVLCPPWVLFLMQAL